MSFFIFNTLTRKKEEFRPISPKNVIMYVCGLTPYDHMHVGHIRTYIAFDVLKRYLIFKGYNVFHIQNITDIDDKILKRAKETNEHPLALAKRFHDEALELMKKLNILPANVYPKVSENISNIISLINKLIEKGYAYETQSGVYFEVAKFKEYGKLSRQSIEEVRAGYRIEIDETKKNPEDFALWKKSKGEILEFDSPWGKGRPGWHIECSAMAGKYATTLDIHGGAIDLIFPHHENEIAQSEAATGKEFVRFWVHTGFLTVKGEKMSKSLGNFITVKDLFKKYNTNTIRLFFLSSHYRSSIDFDEERLEQARKNVEKIFNFYERILELMSESLEDAKEDKIQEIISYFNSFYSSLDDDLDTPSALAHLFSLINFINPLLEKRSLNIQNLFYIKSEFEKIFFIFGLEPQKKQISNLEEKLINIILEIREQARMQKNFELADNIRKKINSLGLTIEDFGEKSKFKFKID